MQSSVVPVHNALPIPHAIDPSSRRPLATSSPSRPQAGRRKQQVVINSTRPRQAQSHSEAAIRAIRSAIRDDPWLVPHQEDPKVPPPRDVPRASTTIGLTRSRNAQGVMTTTYHRLPQQQHSGLSPCSPDPWIPTQQPAAAQSRDNAPQDVRQPVHHQDLTSFLPSLSAPPTTY